MTKYSENYQKIRAAQHSVPDTTASDDFDLDKLGPQTFLSRGVTWLIRHFLLPFLRRFFPVQKLPFTGLTWITRYSDVLEALNNPKDFEVPFGLEMVELAGGVNFALGDDDKLHERQRRIIVEAWKTIDIDRDVRVYSSEIAHALLRDSGGRINIFGDFFTRIAAECSLKAYGLEVKNTDDFADQCLACMALLFGDPNGKPVYREQAMIAAARLRDCLNQNIDRVVDQKIDPNSNLLASVVNQVGEGAERLNKSQRDEIRAIMFGMLIGFTPTNSLSAANIFSGLLRKPELMNETRRRAREFSAILENDESSDDTCIEARETFQRHLFETGRMFPALFPGQFRVRTDSDGAGLSKRLRKIAKGSVVMVATGAALMDPSAFTDPWKHNADRWLKPENGFDLQFGYGLHHCLGEALAKAFITETFRILLTLPGLTWDQSHIVFAGPVPREFLVKFEVESGHRTQTQITSAVPVKSGVPAESIQKILDDLHQQTDLPNGEVTLRERLNRSDILHFCSINLVEFGNEERSDLRVLFEFNVDGDKKTATQRLSNAIGDGLDHLAEHLTSVKPSLWEKLIRLFAGTSSGLQLPADASKLSKLIAEHNAEFHCKPWSTIGLNFVGTGEYSVARIKAEQELFAFIQRTIIDDDQKQVRRQEDKMALSDRPASAEDLVHRTRALVDADPKLRWMLFRTRETSPAFSKHNPATFTTFIQRFLVRKPYDLIYLSLFGATLIIPIMIGIHFGWVNWFISYVVVWAVPIFVALTVAIGLVALLRYRETKVDQPDQSYASHDHMHQIQSMEDLPGYAQNHITSVSELKPGRFRLGTLALALLVIRQMAVQWFRPGFITDFATIHYARWFRLKGTSKLVFQSNYDGSWESYLEDFITKVHGGQTIAWNNAIGFPQTNWWFLDGAKDGDKFKRWVRRQQIKTGFWYSRFPEMTTHHIRTNAMVRDGLARARTVLEYREWEKLFGSTHKGKHVVESDQVQTLLFNGMNSHPYGSCHFLKIEDPDKAKNWISNLVSNSANAESPGQLIKHECALHFGDARIDGPTCFLALTAQGISKLKDEEEDLLTEFPHAFVAGMANRARILGDTPQHDEDFPVAPWNWSWGDARLNEANSTDVKNTLQTVDIAVFIYSKTDGVHDASVDQLVREFGESGLAELRRFKLPINDNEDRPVWAFGFRDGISQPVMRGTTSFARRKPDAKDVVGPGEFILGYPDSRGYYPPSPTVSAGSVGAQHLPPTEAAFDDSIPEFNNRKLNYRRDIGRNGSFLAIRQIETDEEAFTQFLDNTALDFDFDRINSELPKADPRFLNIGLRLRDSSKSSAAEVGHNDKTSEDILSGYQAYAQTLRPESIVAFKREYLAAKMFGRWKDGSSLTRNPFLSKTHTMRVHYWTKIEDCVINAIKELSLRIEAPAEQGGPEAEGLWDKVIDLHVQMIEPKPEGHDFRVSSVVWNDATWSAFVTAAEAIGSKIEHWEQPDSDFQKLGMDNDFLYADEDPQGVHCPIGAHIRRANPRDSMGDNKALQLEINNRHRLLRRGRMYGPFPAKEDAGNDAQDQTQGLMFMCLNANLERQFEFVQQTWLEARSFHGLKNSPDPIVSWKKPGDRFVIPTSSRAVALKFDEVSDQDLPNFRNFSTVVGGGYFFLPGKQALQYLSK